MPILHNNESLRRGWIRILPINKSRGRGSMHIPPINESVMHESMIGGRLPLNRRGFWLPFLRCNCRISTLQDSYILGMRSIRALAPAALILLLLLGVMRICSNHEKNFTSFFAHCRQNASAKKLLQEHEEDRSGKDALEEERWFHQCERERERS